MIPPDECAHIGGAVSIEANYLVGRMPTRTALRLPETRVQLILMYHEATDEDIDYIDTNLIHLYGEEIQMFLEDCAWRERRPIDTAHVATCIVEKFRSGHSLVPTAVVVTGDFESSWFGSHDGGIISEEIKTSRSPYEAKFMRCFTLMPRS